MRRPSFTPLKAAMFAGAAFFAFAAAPAAAQTIVGDTAIFDRAPSQEELERIFSPDAVAKSVERGKALEAAPSNGASNNAANGQLRIDNSVRQNRVESMRPDERRAERAGLDYEDWKDEEWERRWRESRRHDRHDRRWRRRHAEDWHAPRAVDRRWRNRERWVHRDRWDRRESWERRASPRYRHVTRRHVPSGCLQCGSGGGSLLDGVSHAAILINFRLDSATLLAREEGKLHAVGTFLASHPAISLEVSGHADVRGPDWYNFDLSAQRASTVRNYLISAYGIAPHRLRAVGYGETALLPGYSGYDPLNRRVEFRLIR